MFACDVFMRTSCSHEMFLRGCHTGKKIVKVSCQVSCQEKNTCQVSCQVSCKTIKDSWNSLKILDKKVDKKIFLYKKL